MKWIYCVSVIPHEQDGNLCINNAMETRSRHYDRLKAKRDSRYGLNISWVSWLNFKSITLTCMIVRIIKIVVVVVVVVKIVVEVVVIIIIIIIIIMRTPFITR